MRKVYSVRRVYWSSDCLARIEMVQFDSSIGYDAHCQWKTTNLLSLCTREDIIFRLPLKQNVLKRKTCVDLKYPKYL